ncbi:Uncharacterised protein [Salmonella enterica subsp. enterica serovar Typhi]|nr:Uncharacterised protein [Salmonella enterica subsp. enterica serovar Typhi]
MHHRTQNPHTNRHDQEAQRQGRLAAPAVNQADSDEGCQHVSQTNNNGAPHLLRGIRVPRQFEDFRRVIHDDVHPGKLLHYLQQNAKKHGAAEVAVLFEQRPTALFNLQTFANFIELTFCFRTGVTQAQQDAFSIMETAFRRKPARAVRQEEDADQQQNGRDDDHAEHPAPCAAVAERGIGQISAQNPDGDHELVH